MLPCLREFRFGSNCCAGLPWMIANNDKTALCRIDCMIRKRTGNGESMGRRKRRGEEFEIFLEKEILTQERYDRLYGDQIMTGNERAEGRQDAEAEKEQQGEMRMRYEDAQIDERILRAVKELGYEQMTPIQEQAIPLFMTGQDMIGQAQTGTGKTAAFGIPILQKIDVNNRNLQAVILCPTRELAMQAAEELRKFSKYMHGIKVLPIYGGQDIVRQIKCLKAVHRSLWVLRDV